MALIQRNCTTHTITMMRRDLLPVLLQKPETITSCESLAHFPLQRGRKIPSFRYIGPHPNRPFVRAVSTGHVLNRSSIRKTRTLSASNGSQSPVCTTRNNRAIARHMNGDNHRPVQDHFCSPRDYTGFAEKLTRSQESGLHRRSERETEGRDHCTLRLGGI